MNKKLMAVAVAGALGAPALAFAQAANVSLYGNFDGTIRQSRYTSSSVLSPTSTTQGTNAVLLNTPQAASQTKNQLHFNAPRWGLRGTEDLGGGLSAFFQMESGMNPDGRAQTSDGVTAGLGGRDSYIGLRSNAWGSVAVGGFSTAYTNIASIWNAVSSMGHAQIIMGNTDTTGTANNPNCGSAVVGATGALAGLNTLSAANAVVGSGVSNIAATTGQVGTTAQLAAVTLGAAAGNLGGGCTQGVEGNALSFHRRTSNYMEYTTPTMAGFVGKIGTALAENAEPTSQTTAVQLANGGAAATRFNPKHWSYALMWTGGPFSAGIGYETHQGFRGQNTAATASSGLGLNRNSKDKGTTIGGKWNYGAGEIGLGWERLKYGDSSLTAAGANGFQITNWVINGNYKVSAAGTISAGYSKTPGRKSCGVALTTVVAVPVAASDPGLCGSSTSANMFGLSYDHALSKRSGLYAAYGKINNGGNSSAGATYNYIQGPLSNGAGGTTGGLIGGTDVTTWLVGVKHSF